jgi:hypothetical protein
MKMASPLVRAARRVRRYPHVRTVAEIAGAVLLVSGGAAAAVAPAATSTTIHGCANAKTGALSVLLKTGGNLPEGNEGPVLEHQRTAGALRDGSLVRH